MNLRTATCKTIFHACILHAFFLFIAMGAICQEKPSVRGVGEVQTVNSTIGNQYALVVGVSKYHNIQPLLYADDDAMAFKNFLTDTKLVPPANMHVLVDSTATRSRFYAEIKKIMDKLKDNDRVIIYFAGHGDVDNDIDAGFLLGYNCEATPYAASDAIDIAMLERYVDAITKKNVKVILISDACRSGKLTGGTHGAELTLTALSSRFKNTIKILSCGPGELSEETNFRDGGHGIFTYYLLQALYGLCDEDNNNIITKKELDKFLRDKVSKATSDRQNPILEGNANEAILDVIPELKQMMLAKVQNADKGGNMIAQRSFQEKKMVGISVEDSMLVKKFYNQIRDGKLNAPQGDNAYETYVSARKTIANKEIVNSMKYDLAAGLEDDVQPLLNRFTRGEFQDYPYDLFEDANKKLDIIKTDLIDPDDYRYNDIKALQIFFNRAGYYNKQSLADLIRADSVLPNTAYIKLEIGRCFAEQAVPDTANAFKYFRNASRIAPTWPFPHLIAGLLYMDLGMWDQAKAAYTKALDIKSDFKLALINMGVLYSRLKDYDNEMMYYRKAMEIAKPENVVLLGNIALHYKTQDMYDSAIHYYRMGYAVNPWNIYNLSGMIRCFSKLKQKDSVLYYTEKIKNLNPVTDDDYKDIADIYLDLPDYQTAIKYYTQGLAIKGSPFLLNNLGLAYEKLRDFQQAKKYYKMAVAIQPDYTTSLNNLALIYEKSKMYDSAIYYYRRELMANPKDIYNITSLVQNFAKLKQKDSLGYYEKLLDDPKFNNLADLKKVGYMYLDIDPQKSLDYYNKALGFAREAEIYNNMGLAYEYLANISEAKNYYKKAVEVKPDYALSFYNLGLLNYKGEKYDSALYYYMKVYAIDPGDSSNVLSLVQTFVKLKKKDSVLTYLKKLELYQFNANDFRRIGDAYFDISVYNDAARYYRKSIDVNPTVEAYNNLGLVYQRTQDNDNAKKYYRLALEISPEYTTTLSNIAGIFYDNAEYDSSILYYKKLAPLLELPGQTFNMIGASYINSQRYDSAVVYYKKAIEKDPDDANSYVNLGHSYYLNNHFTEAVPYYEKGLKLDQSYTLPIPRLAYGYLLLKRYDDAIRMYQQAIKNDTTTANQSIYYYNLACATSLQGKTTDAVSYFDKSVKTGYLDLKHFEEDTDLDKIRSLPAFRKTIEEHFSKEEIEKYPKLFNK